MTEPSFLAQLSSTIVEAAAAVAPSIVEIASTRSLATGFVWREGLIITADEALSDEGQILIEFSDGTQHPASLVGRDPSTDIALLRVEGAPAPSAVLDQVVPRPGALVVVAAAAESASLVSFGSAIAVGPAWRSMRGGKIDARIELDVRLRRRAEGAWRSARRAMSLEWRCAAPGAEPSSSPLQPLNARRLSSWRMAKSRVAISASGSIRSPLPVAARGRWS